jgi:hypothetical protein
MIPSTPRKSTEFSYLWVEVGFETVDATLELDDAFFRGLQVELRVEEVEVSDVESALDDATGFRQGCEDSGEEVGERVEHGGPFRA